MGHAAHEEDSDFILLGYSRSASGRKDGMPQEPDFGSIMFRVHEYELMGIGGHLS